MPDGIIIQAIDANGNPVRYGELFRVIYLDAGGFRHSDFYESLDKCLDGVRKIVDCRRLQSKGPQP